MSRSRASAAFRRAAPRAFLLLAAAGLAPAFAAGEAPAGGAFDEAVAPILAARCTDCHGRDKQKGELAMHDWGSLAKGGAGGPVVKAGDVAGSEMIHRLRLPASDEDHMPPSDHPQPAPEEIAVLERWIAAGAARDLPVERLELTVAMRAALAGLPRAQPTAGEAEAEAQIDVAAVERARAPLAAQVAALQKRFPGALVYESRSSDRLHFTAAGLGKEFGDAELAALAPLAGKLVKLDVSRTGVTDQAAAVLRGFTALRVFRGGFTELGDAAAGALAGAAQLEACFLNHSRLTDGGLDTLARQTAIRQLGVAGTAVTAAARERAGLK